MGRTVARELGAYVHIGSIVERDEEGKLYNTVLIDREGRIGANLPQDSRLHGYKSLEAQMLTPGTTLSVVETPLGQTASTTCYDLRFPGLWQQLSDRGATAVIWSPAAWPAARHEHWRLLSRARAVEHQAWILAVGIRAGEQPGVALGGYSRCRQPAASSSETWRRRAGRDRRHRCRARDRDQEHFPVLGDELDDYSSISSESGAEVLSARASHGSTSSTLAQPARDGRWKATKHGLLGSR